MAYKFQLGNAKLGGTLQQVGGLVSTDVDDGTAANVVAQIDNGEIPIAKLAAKTISGKDLGTNLGNLTAANNSGLSTISYNGSGDVAVAVEIKANTGITKDNDGIQIALANNKALEFDSGQLAVKVKGNAGMIMNGDGLSVSLQSDALQFDGAAIDLKDTIAGNRNFSGQVEVAQQLKFGNTNNCEIRLNDTAHNVAGKRLEIRAGSTVAGTTSDIAGGNLEFVAGQGKGTGNGGNIEFRVAPAAGSTANTLNGHVTAMSISQNKNVIMQGSLEVATSLQVNQAQVRMGNTANAEITLNDTAHNVAGKPLLIRAGKPVAGTTADIAGGNIIVEAGSGKGTGAGGSIEFKVSTAAGSTADSTNASNRAMIITQDKNAQFAGNLTVDGDLLVSGDTVTMNVSNLAIEDNLIVIRNGAAAADNSGIQIGTSGTPVTLKMADSAANLASSVPLKASSFIGSLNGNANTATTLANARTIGGVSFNGSANIVPQTITVADDESGNAENPMWFGGADGGGAAQPKSDGTCTYNPSTGRITATQFAGDGSNLTGLPASSTVPITDETSDTTCFIPFVLSAGNGGAQALKSQANLKFNASISTLETNNLSATMDLSGKYHTVTTFTKTFNGNITLTDAESQNGVILLNMDNSNRTVTLQPIGRSQAGYHAGRRTVYKRIDGNTGASCTIKCDGSDAHIEGGNSIVLEHGASVTLIHNSDNTMMYII